MSSKRKYSEAMAVSMLPDQPVQVHEPVVEFEIHVCGVTIAGDSSKESCWGVFDRLPTGFRHEMLLRGSNADIWGDTIWGMTKDAYAPAHGPIILEYWDTGEKGILRYRHSWDQDQGQLWRNDLDLEIVYNGVSHRNRYCLPFFNTATPYFWALLPIPARDQLMKMDCSPEMFNGIVVELWQLSESYPTEGIANVKVEFPKDPKYSSLKFSTEGKSFHYSPNELLAVPHEAHSFILSALAKIGGLLPYSKALTIACELATAAELAPKATMSRPDVTATAEKYIQRFLEYVREDKAV